MKDKVKFDYDEWSGNMYVTLARFKHRTTGSIVELVKDINAMIDKEKGVVIGRTIMNFKHVAKDYLKDENEFTSTSQFIQKMLHVATALDSYYEEKSEKTINQINRDIKRKILAA